MYARLFSVFSIICALFAAQQSYGQEIEKPHLVVFHAKWCGPCVKMHKDIEENPELSKFIKDNIEKVWYYDIDTEEGARMYKSYGMGIGKQGGSIPAIAYGYVDLQKRMTIDKRIWGYEGPERLIEQLTRETL